MTLSRRTLLAAGLGSVASTMVPPALFAQENPKTLAEAGRAIGLEVGSAIAEYPKPGVGEIIARECTMITPENVLKPKYVAASKGYYRFGSVENTYSFARRNGLKVHGHTLFWDKEPSGWMEREAEGKSFDEVVALYTDYIRRVISEFPETMSWDVFNEIFEQGQGLRQTVPLATHGLDFVEACLRAAREAAPDARLVINDFHLSCAGDWCDAKRRSVLEHYRELLDRGAPIDAIGIQSHIQSRWAVSGPKTLAFIREAEKMGLEIFLSELDVNDSVFAKDIGRRDEQVASLYREYLGEVLKSPAVKAMTFWGITDADNWIVRPTFSEETIEGATPRPALFDEQLEKKPAYFAVLDLIEKAPSRVELISYRDAQTALTELGFNPGPVDGQWGRRSLGALNALRLERGMAEVATLDIPSQQLLLKLVP